MKVASHSADDESALALFLELVRIDSPSGGEQRLARACADWMRSQGLSVDLEPVDVMGERSTNVWAYTAGDSALDPVLVCAHLDTRWPGIPDVRRGADGWIESRNAVPLGADDKAGVAAVMSAVSTILRRGMRHPPIHVLFTVGEEVGSIGVRASEPIRFGGRRAVVVDADGPVGTLVESSYGRAQAQMRFRPGGEARRYAVWRSLQEAAKQIGPGLSAELVRFDSRDSEWEAAFTVWVSPEIDWRIANARCQTWLKEVERNTAPQEVKWDIVYPAYDVRASSWLHVVKRRIERVRVAPACVRMRDGCDANWLAAMGALPVNVGVGYEFAHSRAERIHVESLEMLSRLLIAVLAEPEREGSEAHV